MPTEALLFRSADSGRTWTPPQIVSLPDGITGNPSSRVIPLSNSNGSLLLPIETWKPYEDSNPPRQRSLALFSSDSGQTWDQCSIAAMDPEARLLYWNGMFSRLSDGRIFVMYWVKDYETGKDLPIRATYSEDEGKTWVEPYSTGIAGQMGSVTDAGNGRIVSAYNVREDPEPGVWMTISEDGGRAWPFGYSALHLGCPWTRAGRFVGPKSTWHI